MNYLFNSIKNRFNKILSPFHQFILIAITLAILFLSTANVIMAGDIYEYVSMTVAIAEHGTPNILISDLEKVKKFFPALAEFTNQMKIGIEKNHDIPVLGFSKGEDDYYYAIHFFAYSAFAAIPFKILEILGLNPLKCFQVVNICFVFILNLSLYRLFNSTIKALGSLLLFLACSGYFYLHWSSPECMSAAALLAGMVFFATGTPLRAGFLVGLASMQNPPIIFCLGFVPFILIFTNQGISQNGQEMGWYEILCSIFSRRLIAGLSIGGLLFIIPIIFSLYEFKAINIIAKMATDPNLISIERFYSFFFDLNQGMVIGIPGVLFLIGFYIAKNNQKINNIKFLSVILLLVFSFAIPSLSTYNWNSGAQGMMRYAFWSAMPLLLFLFWIAKDEEVFSFKFVIPVITLAILQGLAMVSMSRYNYLEFSPIAKFVLNYAPSFYNPESEIFVERLSNNESVIPESNKLYIYSNINNKNPTKTLYNNSNYYADNEVCGEEKTISHKNKFHELGRGWKYINGIPECIEPDIRFVKNHVYLTKDFEINQKIQLKSGWANPEFGISGWNGVWSLGGESIIIIPLDAGQKIHALTLTGFYYRGNQKTHVFINGEDFGWINLENAPIISIKDKIKDNTYNKIIIKLEHQAPSQVTLAESRILAFFLTVISFKTTPDN